MKPEGKRPLGRPRCRCENDIRMYHKEIGCKDVDWIHLAQDKVQWQAPVNMIMILLVP
jgi:hypothetical protein